MTPVGNITQGLTAKEKSFAGMISQPFLKEDFCTVSSSAKPDVSEWTTTQDDQCAATVHHGEGITYVKVLATHRIGNACTIKTNDKKCWNMAELALHGLTSLRLKARVQIPDLTGQCGIGFWIRTGGNAATFDRGNHDICSLYCFDDVVKLNSSDGTVKEETTITGEISDNTWFNFEIVVTASDVKYYIDDVLKATHTEHLPDAPLCVGVSARFVSAITPIIKVQYIHVWVE